MKYKALVNLSCDGETYEAGRLYPSPLPKAVDPSNFEAVGAPDETITDKHEGEAGTTAGSEAKPVPKKRK